MKYHPITKVIVHVLGLAGWIFLAAINWRIALAMTVIFWSNNLSQSDK